MDIRDNISKNIIFLRTKAGMTQADFARQMNYSDKAISKWERNESIPDITVLARIAEYFGVSIDALVNTRLGEDVETEPVDVRKEQKKRKNHAMITAMSACLVWVIAILGFAFGLPFTVKFPLWLLFVYALPVTAIVCLVLTCVWFGRKLKFTLISILMWSLVISIYLTFLLTLGVNFWPLFITCAPGQAIILLWGRVRR